MKPLQWIVCGIALILTSCAVGPNYKRPVVPTPEQYRMPEDAQAPNTVLDPDVAMTMADLPWWEIFQDPVLVQLITTAIEQNYDLKIAVARTEQASQQVTATRSAFFPQVSYNGAARRTRYPIDLIPNSKQTFTSFMGLLSVGWELDVWGRIRRANQAAKADLLASEDSQRGVILSLVSQVSALYFKLLQLDAQLEIAQEAVVAFDKTLDLFTRQYQGGVASRLPVTRAAAAEAQARAWVPEVQIQTALVENQLSVLLGRPPGPIARGAPLIDQQLPEIPPGLPSALLERRPDIQRAEQAVVASNAEIGVAIGNFLPRVGLTALWGGSSENLSNLATGSANIWSIAAEFSGPIFRAGMLWAEYKARVAFWEESKAIYERAALEAFAEVADSLTSRSLLGEQRRAFAEQSKQLAESVRLSLLRYNQGLASYFEVLQAQQELYPALYNLAETRTAELESVISLYKALGGGWQLGTQWLPEPPAPPEPEEVETILLPLTILRKPETAPSCPPVRLRITPPRCAD